VDEISADWLVVAVGWVQPLRDSLLLCPGFSEEGAGAAQTSLPLLVCSQRRVAGGCHWCHVHPAVIGPL